MDPAVLNRRKSLPLVDLIRFLRNCAVSRCGPCQDNDVGLRVGHGRALKPTDGVGKERERDGPRGGWDARYALKAILFQYREHFALRRNPDLGEEAFLIAERAA